MFTIDLFTYWKVKLCQQKIHFICTLRDKLDISEINDILIHQRGYGKRATLVPEI